MPHILETPQRIEPARLEELTEPLSDAIAELSAEAAMLGRALHPRTAAGLAAMVRIMNAYYSNLIEGHNTRPKDIERALAGEFDQNQERRNLQLEAAAHVSVQANIDRLAAAGRLPEPATEAFIKELHRQFYADAPAEMLILPGAHGDLIMTPGEWRSGAEHDVTVGRHAPPASQRIPDFMRYFEERYHLAGTGKAGRITALAAAHHRFNYIHPFPDGNGRVSRLMSHAMTYSADIGAHGLWSISRGLARGLTSRGEYKRMMDYADTPRQGDLDGRGNLSLKALAEFTLWFVKVALDQVKFMASLFELDTLSHRLRVCIERDDRLKNESAWLLEEAFRRGSFERGEAARLTRLPTRTAQRLLNDLVAVGLLQSDTPKGVVSLRFPIELQESLFPKLFPET